MIDLESLLKNKVGSLLVNENLEKSLEKYAVVIDASSLDEEIMCKYNTKTGIKESPDWLKKLSENKVSNYSMLIIKNMDEVDAHKQLRFKEILKNKSINGIPLPENSVIVVSYKKSCESIIDIINNELIKIA